MQLEDYIKDNYGSCSLAEDCICLRKGMRGRSCPNWEPTEATDWEGLRAIAQETLDKFGVEDDDCISD